MAGREDERQASGGGSGVRKWRRSGGRGRRGRGHGRGGRRHRPRKTQEQLDLEMDLMAAERDGRDVEEVKAAYRKKVEEKAKSKLDSQMDSYFAEEEASAGAGVEDVGAAENPGPADTNGASGAPAKAAAEP